MAQEKIDQLDINGWDLRKALQLLRKCNPPLMEWLGSPIVYWEELTVAARMRELMSKYFSPVACLYHYLHMARGNYRDYLKGPAVWIKKYFYVLRPILAINWFGGKSARGRAVDSEWLPIADAQALLDRQTRRAYAGGAWPRGVTTS